MPSSGLPSCFGQRREIRLISVGRPAPSIIASATSSSSSVASTRALLPKIKAKKSIYYQTTREKMTQKEKNLLMQVPPTVQESKKPEEPTEEKKPQRKNHIKEALAAITVSLCSLCVGYASAYTSPALVSMNEPNTTYYMKISDQESSWIGSLMPLFGLIGGAVGGTLIEVFGRKKTIMGIAIPFIVAYIVIYFAENSAMIMVGRAMVGFGAGVATLSLPVYLGETLQPEVRGMFGLFPTTFGNIGILLCYYMGAYLNWRGLALVAGLLAVPYFFLMFFLPETPRWYIGKNKPEKAESALKWLRGNTADIIPELDDLQKTSVRDDQPASFSDMSQKRYLWPLSISLALMFFQQMTGINAVIFYTKDIFQSAGSTIDSDVSSIMIGVVNLAATLMATVLIDRLGRKILMYVSTILMTLTLGGLGLFFYCKHIDIDMSQYGWLPLGCLVVYVVGFSFGIGPIPWLMMGEILPARVRGTAAAIATAFNWSCTFIVTKTFVDLTRVLGSHGAFWLFGFISILCLFFVIFLVPETQGKSLEDIERYFAGKEKSTSSGSTRRRLSSLANMKTLPSTL